MQQLEQKIKDTEEENSRLRVKITDMETAFEEIIYTAKQQI
mgnify:CR=1 FL=1